MSCSGTWPGTDQVSYHQPYPGVHRPTNWVNVKQKGNQLMEKPVHSVHSGSQLTSLLPVEIYCINPCTNYPIEDYFALTTDLFSKILVVKLSCCCCCWKNTPFKIMTFVQFSSISDVNLFTLMWEKTHGGALKPEPLKKTEKDWSSLLLPGLCRFKRMKAVMAYRRLCGYWFPITSVLKRGSFLSTKQGQWVFSACLWSASKFTE